MKVIIIDDEPLARSIVRSYLSKYTELAIVAECGNGFDGLKAIQELTPDLVFLDIQMPKLNGFELLELLENPPAIIFTTAFEEFALKAFDVNAIDYLLKPFSQERFDAAIQKMLQQKNAQESIQNNTLLETMSLTPEQRSRIVVKDRGKIKIIPLQQIQYIEAADDYIKIFTEEGSFLKNKSMQQMEQTLPIAQFIRVHRSYIVNLSLITRIDPYEKDGHLLLMSTGVKLNVSKTGYTRLKEALGI